MSLLLSDLSDYAEANAEYVRIFGVNPPARACVQANITKGVSLSAVGFKSQKQEVTRELTSEQSLVDGGCFE